MPEIIPFEPHHHEAALALWQRTPGVGLSAADERPAIEQFLARNAGLSRVALAGGELVGTVLVGHDGRRGLIHHLAVAETARRQGIGRRLVGEAMHGLAAAGIAKCHLLVFSNNVPGRAFWAAVGADHRAVLAVYSLPTA